MKNSHRFFNNNECKYFPCHETDKPDEYNCLFCYCPLYALGDRCGGSFTYNATGTIKLCDDCKLPHQPEYYDVIIQKLEDEAVKRYIESQK